VQQRGKGAPDIQKQWEMKDRLARLRLSLEKHLDLNRLNKLEDIELRETERGIISYNWALFHWAEPRGLNTWGDTALKYKKGRE